jgi:hypothetical protein
MNEEEFYERCARLLGTGTEIHEVPGVVSRPRHDGTIRNTHKTRYNDREPGNGRFPGRGLVRHFGKGVTVSLRDPPLHGYYETPEAALGAITAAMGIQDHFTEEEIAAIKANRIPVNEAAKAIVKKAGVTADVRLTLRKVVIAFLDLKLSEKMDICRQLGYDIVYTDDFLQIPNRAKQDGKIEELSRLIAEKANAE